MNPVLPGLSLLPAHIFGHETERTKKREREQDRSPEAVFSEETLPSLGPQQ